VTLTHPKNLARTLTTFNAVMTFVWVGLVVPTMIWWKDSILWVALMSLWANIASHFAAYIAGRAELQAQTAEDKTKL
jgi:hypothetical protein